MSTRSREEPWRREWCKQERNTAALVRTCYDLISARRPPNAEDIHALARLTWIVKSQGEVVDNTRAVVAPALSVLLDVQLVSTHVDALVEELDYEGVSPDIASHVRSGVGFVNFYAGFRNIALSWLQEHEVTARAMAATIRSGPTDAEARAVYEQIEALPPLPRLGGGDMPAFNLLTPLFACLDPRERCPVINSRQEVRDKLRALKLSHAGLAAQYDGVSGLLHQGGIDGAFDFDTASVERIVDVFRDRPNPAPVVRRPARPLAERCDEDLEVLLEADKRECKRVHNSMTNALRVLCNSAYLEVTEGTDRSALFDALIHGYKMSERDLLVELKTSTAPEFCRLAVGQLLDYRRGLPRRAATDLCVLLPEQPPSGVKAFLRDVGVLVAWFTADLSAIKGDVRISR